MSDTRWPTLPIPSDAAHVPASGDVGYTLLVEQSVGSGNGLRWLAAPATRTAWADRELARHEAERFARTYQPRHPMTEQRRGVYRISPDEYLTIVEGATMTFSFRTVVAEPLGWQGRQGAPR
ncbi:MAG: hypothetical protein QM582_02640 [Micropruina sp.]|uniref:hypothetical protein n=1 Tax=Micropruina sp. TaxID=2737536 RepID=UPI0039E372CD